jgi:hypothetical protein
MVTKAGR